jgi:hypothetical protein
MDIFSIFDNDQVHFIVLELIIKPFLMLQNTKESLTARIGKQKK